MGVSERHVEELRVLDGEEQKANRCLVLNSMNTSLSLWFLLQGGEVGLRVGHFSTRESL